MRYPRGGQKGTKVLTGKGETDKDPGEGNTRWWPK